MACLKYAYGWAITSFASFVFFDGNQLVVLLSGFQKKTQKTPKYEIKRAVKIMNDYYNDKKEVAK